MSEQQGKPGMNPDRYTGPKDTGRAESLFLTAKVKPDLDYSAQLLFSALLANPEHGGAFAAILGKIPAFAAAGRKMLVRIGDLLTGNPADAFIRTLAVYCAAPSVDGALACATEANKAGLISHAVTLAMRVLEEVDAKKARGSQLLRLVEILEASGDYERAIRAARLGLRDFPTEQIFREREKNLLARQYLKDTNLEAAESFQQNLKDRAGQESLHRPTDSISRLGELERKYQQSSSLEDFREWVRGLRDASADQREAGLPTLRDGLRRFGDRETAWFIREIEIERRWAEIRLNQRLVQENPRDQDLKQEHERAREAVLRDHVEYLYEVVGSMPPCPERHKQEIALAKLLLDAGRFEEAIKQSQTARRRPEHRLAAMLLMARAFVRLDLAPEAEECFRSVLAELASGEGGSPERVLEAKYTYAEFLVQEAQGRKDAGLAKQARKLCADIMIEDIDYRGVRALAARAEELSRS